MMNQGFPQNTFRFLSILSNTTIKASVLTGILLLSASAGTIPVLANQVKSTLTAQLPLGATILYVNPTTGQDSPNSGTSEATAYRTITYAMQQAQSGTVIQVSSGTYTVDTGEVFPIVVKRGVILRGDEATKGQTIGIIGGGGYASPTLAGQNITIRAERDTEIRGLGISNPNTRGTGLWIESTNATVANNTFSNSKREGVFVTGTATPKVEGNIFTRNDGNGISVAREAKGEINNNVFENTGNGIVLSESAAPTITENRIIQNRQGVDVSGSATPILRKNIIENNRENGVVATSSAQPDLGTQESPGENRIRNNGRYDVYNATRTMTIVAVGNDIDQKRISGRVDFVAASIPDPGTGTGTASKFRDVQGHWAQAYIETLASQNIIAGFPDGNFRPSDPVTRAQFAAIISKAFTPAPERGATSFVDVNSRYWAFQAIQTAYRGAFVSGYPGQLFRPEQRIPRVQVLVSLASGLKLRSNNTDVLSVFGDAAQIPTYAQTAIAGATIRELVINYPTPSQLAPNREATRAEVAAFVYQALVGAGRVQPIPSPYLVKAPQ